jgi:hypothetical protein
VEDVALLVGGGGGGGGVEGSLEQWVRFACVLLGDVYDARSHEHQILNSKS